MLEECMNKFALNTVPADDLAPLGHLQARDD